MLLWLRDALGRSESSAPCGRADAIAAAHASQRDSATARQPVPNDSRRGTAEVPPRWLSSGFPWPEPRHRALGQCARGRRQVRDQLLDTRGAGQLARLGLT